MRSFILRTIIIVEDDDDDDDVLVMMLLLGFVVPSLLSPKTLSKFVFDDRANRNIEMASSRARMRCAMMSSGTAANTPSVTSLSFFLSRKRTMYVEKKKSFLVVVSPSRCKRTSRSQKVRLMKTRERKEEGKGNGKKREEDRERVLTFIIPFAWRVLVSL